MPTFHISNLEKILAIHLYCRIKEVLNQVTKTKETENQHEYNLPQIENTM